jgi:hypothetical protein
LAAVTAAIAAYNDICEVLHGRNPEGNPPGADTEARERAVVGPRRKPLPAGHEANGLPTREIKARHPDLGVLVLCQQNGRSQLIDDL